MAETSSTSTSKTVFIVGAGASKEAGLPIGSELKKSIAKALDIRFDRARGMVSGDHHVFEALRLAVAQDPTPDRLLQSFQQAGWHIRDAMPQAISIDNFIDTRSHDKQIELCGKLAIVRTILEAESKSALFVEGIRGNGKLKFEKLESTWFNSFFQRLTENCKSADLAKRLSSIVLVIFNYDRCIEHYLYYALQNYYSMSASDVGSLLQSLKSYHPYGTVGSLPWLSPGNAIEFGDTPNSPQLLMLARQIKTFTEGTDESASDVTAIRSHMKVSHRLVFLGFAFDSLNLELLLPNASSTSPPTGRRVFATAHGISNSNTAAISAELASRGVLSARDIQIRNDLTCSQLFQEYSRSMSFT
jgi:hypothetical protein